MRVGGYTGGDVVSLSGLAVGAGRYPEEYLLEVAMTLLTGKLGER